MLSIKLLLLKNHYYYYYYCYYLLFIILVYEGNEEESLHEGDIRLSYKQQIALEMFGDPTAPVLGARGITKYQKLLWNTRVVPYNISSELGEMNNETEKKKLLGVFAACFDTCARKTLIQCYALRKHYYYYLLFCH